MQNLLIDSRAPLIWKVKVGVFWFINKMVGLLNPGDWRPDISFYFVTADNSIKIIRTGKRG